MIIIGNGQLAQAFENVNFDSDICVFASGVSNSTCQEKDQFKREKELLLDALLKYENKTFVYFSSCALSALDYPKNEYYKHKDAMEKIIKKHHSDYYIFRLPQLFGDLIEHQTLINFIYMSIVSDCIFDVYDEGHRYVIEINDVTTLVTHFIEHVDSCITVDLANTYRYQILEIVHILERLLNKKAHYNVVKKQDKYSLNLAYVDEFVKSHKLNIEFGKNYLSTKLEDKISAEKTI